MPGVFDRERTPAPVRTVVGIVPVPHWIFLHLRVLRQPRLNSRKTETDTASPSRQTRVVAFVFFFFSLVPHVQSYPTSQRTS